VSVLIFWRLFFAITALHGLDSNTRSIIIQLCFELRLGLVLAKNSAPNQTTQTVLPETSLCFINKN